MSYSLRDILSSFFFNHRILPLRTLSKLILFLRSPQTEFKISSKSQFKGYVLFAIFNTRNQLTVLQTLINSSLQNSYSNDSYIALISIFSFRGIFSMYLRVITQLSQISLLQTENSTLPNASPTPQTHKHIPSHLSIHPSILPYLEACFFILSCILELSTLHFDQKHTDFTIY